ncbi:protein AF1q isoform X2 [Eleginops maclovinus]|uniref:protein AF1q isoform X2 n=1 Tax=Eleginops maclovinus TaxID=56733 RepID=UPI00307FFE20
MQKSKSEYESFVFWRAPLPELDFSELMDVSCGAGLATSATGKERKQEMEGEMKEFSSFNYWRAPIADVDTLLADLNLLL